MTVLLVTGARSFGPEDAKQVRRILATLDYIDEVFVGDARGVDAVAREVAREGDCELHVFGADWKAHGRGAGPLRNEAMVRAAIAKAEELRTPLLCLAFPGPESRGTWDCMKRIVAHGREIDRVIPVGQGS